MPTRAGRSILDGPEMGLLRSTARRVAAAIAALSLLASSAPASAACQSPEAPYFVDSVRGTEVWMDRAERELVFTTADGRQLFGRNARVVGQRRVTAVSNGRNLTIVLRFDLKTGRAQATAVERDLGVVSRPDKRTKRDPFRHVHTLSVSPATAQNCG
jgi:hypothetical protein